jgi:hypothetical protein
MLETRYNDDMSRLVKQLIIGGIYVLILFGILWVGYRWFVPAPTCTDGIQNGAEDGLDCGAAACGVLCPAAVLPLEVGPARILKAGTGYDVLVYLENPNPLYGASRVEYVLTVTDAAGAPVALRRGVTYVNPTQPRYMLFPLTGISMIPANAELQITPATVQWSALTVDAKGDIQFGVHGERFVPSSSSLYFEAAVLNRSQFTFDTVDVTVLIFDERGEVVSANTTVQRTLAAGEERAFRMEWPFAVPGASRAEIMVTTNVFANDNFIRVYGSPESLQGF